MENGEAGTVSIPMLLIAGQTTTRTHTSLPREETAKIVSDHHSLFSKVLQSESVSESPIYNRKPGSAIESAFQVHLFKKMQNRKHRKHTTG